MLVQFTIGNYKSFSEKQTLNLVAGNSDELAGNCADRGNLKLLKAAGIYGPNASGKSNLLDALSTMQQIIEDPAKPGKRLPIKPFKLDDKYSGEPSFFEVIFYHGQIRYQYGFTATAERIYDEWLYANPIGRSRDVQQTWFERKFDKQTGETNWDWGVYLKGEREKLKSMTLDNVLFLSVGAQLNNEQLKSVYEWFSKKLVILPSQMWPAITVAMLKDKDGSTNLRDYIVDIVRKADFGIYDINISEKKIDPKKFGFLPNATEDLRNRFINKIATRIEFIHLKADGEKISFSPFEESDGTERFFALAGPFISAVANEETLLIDELEASLHPLLVYELIKFIQGTTTSEQTAQLIFSTHDTTLLNPELFRRDQIWFTEKDEHGSTQLYSMLDYKNKPRKGEAMQKGYLSGRYGAIPMIEAFKLNG